MGRPSRAENAAALPTASCASRNGTPRSTRYSAASVASASPEPSASSMRSAWNVAVSTAPATASAVSTSASGPPSSGRLSSCRSRLYESGRPFRIASSATRSPSARPARPRASSPTSGFFFCGMSEEPVANASASVAKPNSFVVQRTSSSPMRERCTAASAHANRSSAALSRSETASSELCVTPASPSRAATASRSSGRVVPASAPEPSGEIAARRRTSANRSRSRPNIST
ncbi:hypothetical protein PSR1_03705 [Anaeromyxobacter sp. PSR-1]|nr:hypothetical protein PSR1_03705 [Anaeromyxobacter sp. PSR-1]